MKLSRLGDLYRETGSRFYSLFLSGEMVGMAVLLTALLVSVLLLAVPALRFKQQEGGAPWRSMLYFLGLGAGFMLTELYFILKFTLLFGSPAISLTVVLGGLLIFSGAGGILSQKIGTGGHIAGLALLMALLGLFFLFMDTVAQGLLQAAGGLRLFLSLGLLLPLGLLMGLPLPFGMRVLAANPSHRAYAWAANGCASVLASVAAVQVGINAGLPMILACAVMAYLVSLVIVSRHGERR
jgi:hypothetical protein